MLIVQECFSTFRMDSRHAYSFCDYDLVRVLEHAQVANEMDWNAISH